MCLRHFVIKVMGWLQCLFSKAILQIMGNNRLPQGFFKVKVLLENECLPTLSICYGRY